MKEKGKVFKSAASGSASGIINGFFGGGGGLILVPLLKRFVNLPVKKAHATCVIIAGMMSVVTAIVYLAKGAVHFHDAWFYMIGGAVGGVVGALLLDRIPQKWLRRIFGLFLIYSAVRMLFYG